MLKLQQPASSGRTFERVKYKDGAYGNGNNSLTRSSK